MTRLEWKDSYSVGDAHIDAQHQGLIALINMLDDAQMVGPVIDRLQTYVDEHFRDEEKLMEQAGYPDLAAHREHHAAFEEWLESVRQAQLSGEVAWLLRESMQDYLKNWLVNHILVSDQDYAPYLNQEAPVS